MSNLLDCLARPLLDSEDDSWRSGGKTARVDGERAESPPVAKLVRMHASSGIGPVPIDNQRTGLNLQATHRSKLPGLYCRHLPLGGRRVARELTSTIARRVALPAPRPVAVAPRRPAPSPADDNDAPLLPVASCRGSLASYQRCPPHLKMKQRHGYPARDLAQSGGRSGEPVGIKPNVVLFAGW